MTDQLPPAPEGMEWTLTPAPQVHTCASCSRKLKSVFPPEVSATNYEDALEVILSGGWGMFFDNIDGDPKVYLCHSCAHVACEALPWLKQVVGPLHGACDRVVKWDENDDGTSCIGYIPGGEENP
ncbi:hypothetical protein HOV03_gp89 [Gordonia phage Asapag]|uniref:Uncharacterized protein n=1 Tax=Gordonia phage Asapag TaxID=2507862 RepID=A0A410TDY3_9CAUD|nr:hypothetical protein HOV03_gp89 [Gordonia phage Asapag]QAU07228.1 hypothetical protein SEA_ASAPAG_89 [Gordonia phage Asapag]